jgi:ElaB/YqjD/DUF883 family membrane-anchored ribosome-binding protein
MDHRPGIGDVQRLIGEVAKRHNILIDADDPIFIGVTLNELVVARAIEQVQAALAATLAGIALASAQQRDEAKAIAEQLITSAAAYVANEVKAASGELEAALRRTAREELSRLRVAAAEAQHARHAASWAAIAAMAAVCLLAGALLASWLSGGDCNWQSPGLKFRTAAAAVLAPAIPLRVICPVPACRQTYSRGSAGAGHSTSRMSRIYGSRLTHSLMQSVSDIT